MYAGGALDRNNRQLLVMAVRKSIDSGNTWSEFQLSQTYGAVYSLALHPSNSNIIYAGGYDRGGFRKILKSIDAGLHWEDASSGIDEACKSVIVIIFHPQSSDTLFAGCENGIYRSVNAGMNWTKLNDNLSGINSIVIDGDSSMTFYAGSKYNGFFISHDGGQNWSSYNEGLSDIQIYSMALDPINHLIFAGTTTCGVWRYDPKAIPPPKPVVPERFDLKPNYPNPFNQMTTIVYEIPESDPIPVTLKIYNIMGQLIKVLLNDIRETGRYAVQWDGRDENGSPMTSGIYFCVLKAGKHMPHTNMSWETMIQKMMPRECAFWK